MYGKKYMGVERSTFVIGADGVLLKEMRKVNPETHADDVLAALPAAGEYEPIRVPDAANRGPHGPRAHMRMRGLEPPRPERHTDLNRARLPIPPHPRADDSSRRHGYWHAARKPAPPIGVTASMNRIPGLLIALALCCLAAGCGSAEHAAVERPDERGGRHVRLARRRGQDGRRRTRRARDGSTASRRGSPRRSNETIPGARIHWRYRVVLNGAAVVVPSRSVARAADAPGRREPSTRAPPTASARATSPTSCEPPRRGRRASRTTAPGSRSGSSTTASTRRTRTSRPSATRCLPGFPKGQTAYTTAKVIVARAFAPAERDLEVRAQALRPRPVGARDPRRRHRRRQRRTRRRAAGSRSPASPRRRTSATTRRSPSRPTRTSASTATPPRSSPRSKPPWRTGWT